jgi:hypothetical protein
MFPALRDEVPDQNITTWMGHRPLRGTKKDRENAFRNSFVSSRNPDEAELTLRASDCVGAQQE